MPMRAIRPFPLRLLPTVAPALMLAAGLAAPAHGQTYAITLNQAASSATYTLSVNAPVAVSPALPQNAPIPTNTSYLIGGAAATPPTTPATITRPSTSFLNGNFSTNQPVGITGGSIAASGNNGANPLRPRGGLTLALNPGASSVLVSGVNLDLLGGATTSIAVNVSIGFQSFHTRNPNSLFLIPSATVPVTLQASVTNLAAAQAAGTSAAGTLTPVAGSPGVYTFSAPVQVVVSVTASLSGSAVPVDPQPVDITLAGTIDTRTTPATVASTIAITNDTTQPGPTPLGAQVFDEPIYGGKLLATIVLASTTVNLSANATIAATGVLTGDPADFNGDGVVDPDDLSDFITAFFGQPADPRADFNGDGATDPDDLSDFITAFFS